MTTPILIRLYRPEGYEDVHPELVVQDADINEAFLPEIVAPSNDYQRGYADALGAAAVYVSEHYVDGDDHAACIRGLERPAAGGEGRKSLYKQPEDSPTYAAMNNTPGVPVPTFCAYCGGNDETPQGHCMDCARPGNVPVCSSCGGAGCVDCATDGVLGAETEIPVSGTAGVKTGGGDDGR